MSGLKLSIIQGREDREKESETDGERRERERCVARCSSLGHEAALSPLFL